ncbi:Anthocyanidin 3-O-glucosyltransferase 7 [Dionaea muscipula]
MATPALTENPPMPSKPIARHKPPSSSLASDGVLFLGGALVSLLLVWSFLSFTNPSGGGGLNFSSAAVSSECSGAAHGFDPLHDPPDPTFYDEPEVGYTLGTKIRDWDEKRRRWMELHPSFSPGAKERVLMVTGSQPTPCKNPMGDHFLLRLFKNKVDYCRIHGHDIFYNNVLLHPEMFTFWAKYPAVRAAMVAHPEAEWIWWVDSDAAITDMEFKLPLERYREHNLVVHGWPELIYKKKSWTGLNAGVFLIRNCQWSMDLIERWAGMGPQSPDYDRWGQILRSEFKDKLFPQSDDQTGLGYLIVEEKERWGEKIYMEGEYYFEGYWVEIVGKLERVAERYGELERNRLRRRRRAEKVGEWYGALLEEELRREGAEHGKRGWRRPFITHFTGCQPCSGRHNEAYEAETCRRGMDKALNFADNQVLRSFGYTHPSLLNSSSVVPLSFDSDFPSSSSPPSHN